MSLENGSDGRAQRWQSRAIAASTGRPSGKVTLKKLMQLVEWQNFRCAITGRKLSPEDTALDHVIAVSKGGEHVMENLQAVCREANQAKRTLSMEEFVSLCRDVVATADSQKSSEQVA